MLYSVRYEFLSLFFVCSEGVNAYIYSERCLFSFYTNRTYLDKADCSNNIGFLSIAQQLCIPLTYDNIQVSVQTACTTGSTTGGENLLIILTNSVVKLFQQLTTTTFI